MKTEIKYDMSELGRLVTHIKGLIKDEVDNENPLDIASWTHEFGIALSVNDAQKIVDFIDGMTDSFTKNELNIPGVITSYLAECDVCKCHPSVLIRTQFGSFCEAHVRYV